MPLGQHFQNELFSKWAIFSSHDYKLHSLSLTSTISRHWLKQRNTVSSRYLSIHHVSLPFPTKSSWDSVDVDCLLLSILG